MISSLFRTVSALTAAESLVFNDFQTGQPISFKVSAIDSIVGRRKDPKSLFWKGDQCFIWQSGSRFHVRSSRSEVLTEISNLAATVTSSLIILEDQKSGTTNGGTFTTGGWRTRDLNTKISDPEGLASLASNQITLQSGTFRVTARAPASQTNMHWLRLQDVDNAETLLEGLNSYSPNSTFEDQTHAFLQGSFTITVETTLELQHRGMSSRSDYGFGISGGDRDPQVYTQIILEPVT